MLVHRLRHWLNIKPALIQRVAFAAGIWMLWSWGAMAAAWWFNASERIGMLHRIEWRHWGPPQIDELRLYPMSVQCWASVEDGGPALNRRWVDVFSEMCGRSRGCKQTPVIGTRMRRQLKWCESFNGNVHALSALIEYNIISNSPYNFYFCYTLSVIVSLMPTETANLKNRHLFDRDAY